MSHLSLLEKFKPYLGPSTSKNQTLVLAGLAFAPSSDEFEKLELVYVTNVLVYVFIYLLKAKVKNPVCKQCFFSWNGESRGAGCYYVNAYANVV